MQNNPIMDRRYDLDWLRVLAVLLLVPFHSALIFDLDLYAIVYIKDTVNSNFLCKSAGILNTFHMPLLFFIAGASSYFSLQKRSSNQYLTERVKRLLIPMLFGLAVLVPPMTYITQISKHTGISFFQHYINFWHINFNDISGVNGTFTPAHLWFILFLFVFSIIALPVFMQIHRQGNKFLHKAADIFSKGGMIFMFVIPLSLVAAIPVMGDKNPLYYFSIFFLGYMLIADDRYQKAIDRYTVTALLAGLVIWLVRPVLWNCSSNSFVQWLVRSFGFQAVRWLWLIAALGLGHKFLNRKGKLLQYLSKSSYPFYLLHMLSVTVVGFFIIRYPLSIGIKFTAIVLLAILLTFIEYEILRRIPGIRFLLGVKRTVKSNKK